MKRKQILIWFLAIALLPVISLGQGVKVLGPVVPNASSDLYATHIDSLGKGGFMAVTDKLSRDNISTQRRKKGMLVYVNETDSVYQLIGGIANTNWIAYKLTSNPSASTMGWKGSLATAPQNPKVNWGYYNSTDKKSYLWDGDSWETLSQDGANGIGLIWRGTFTTPPPVPQLNWGYYNSLNRKSYIWDGDSWEVFAQDGVNGTPGTQGLKGATGANGIGLLWQGSLTSAPATPQLNWGYYNSTDKKSYIWDGDSWEVFAQDGINGAPGSNGIGLAWQGTFVSAPSAPQLNWGYYNSTDKKSYLWDGDSWEVFAVDGSAGSSGSNGVGLAWQGTFTSVPASPQLNWAYYNSTDKKSYLWDGDSWEILAQDGTGSGSVIFNGSRPITLGLSPFNGMNPNTNDLAAWIESVFYPSLGPTAALSMSFVNPITSSTVTGTSSTLEMMSAGANISVTLNWTAGRQSSTANLASVTVGGNSQTFTQPAQGATVSGSATSSFPRNTNTSFSNQVLTSDSKSASASVSVNFSWKRYYGFMTAPGGVANGTGFSPGNSEVLALSNSGFASSRAFTSASLTPSGSQRMVIAYPLAWDPSPSTSAQIWIGGLESSGGFQRNVITLTNASGGSTDYVVYVQMNNQSGNISFNIQ